MKDETRFKEFLAKRLNMVDNLYWLKTNEVSKRGVPDILFCKDGKFGAWELKTSVGVIDKLQAYTLGRIKQAGGVAEVVTPENWQEQMGRLRSL